MNGVKGSPVLPSDDPVFMLESLTHTRIKTIRLTTVQHSRSSGKWKDCHNRENREQLMKMWDLT